MGSVVTLSATITVSGHAATGGTVNFLDGTRSLGTVQVIVSGAEVGTAFLKTNSFGPGNHNLTASYSGAPNGSQEAGPSTSSPVALLVQPAPVASVTTLAVTQEPSGPYDFSATVAAVGNPVPTGSVTFINQTSGMSLGTELVASGGVSASFPAEFQTPYATGANPASIAVGDFNQDGIPDFAVANGDGTISVILGDPSNPGHFLSQVSYTAGNTPTSIVTADFNGDGVLDLATSDYQHATISILLGSSSTPGHFLPPTLYSTGTGGTLVVADFNLDGLPDLASVGGSTVVLLNNPNSPGVLVAQPATYPMGYTSAAAGDFNGNGYPDLAVDNPGTATVFFGDPAHPGQFLLQKPTCSVNCGLLSGSSSVVPSGSSLVVAGDFNEDGVLDLAMQYDLPGNLQVVVFLGDPVNRGSFLAPATYTLASFNYFHGSGGATGLVVGDFNADGLQDLAALWFETAGVPTPAIGWHVALFLGDPNQPGQFSVASGYSSPNYLQPAGLAQGDFMGDGLSDLVFSHDQQNAEVLLNASSATATLDGTLITGPGSQVLVATYSGDSNLQPSTSGPLSIPGSVATTTTLTTSAFVINAGDAITFTAAVSSGQGTVPQFGTVTFYDGSTNIVSVPLTAQGTAAWTTTNGLTIGSHAISAAYALNGIWLPSTSATLDITVRQPGPVQNSGFAVRPGDAMPHYGHAGERIYWSFRSPKPGWRHAPGCANSAERLRHPKQCHGLRVECHSRAARPARLLVDLANRSPATNGLYPEFLGWTGDCKCSYCACRRRWFHLGVREQCKRCGPRHQRIFHSNHRAKWSCVLPGDSLPYRGYKRKRFHGRVWPAVNAGSLQPFLSHSTKRMPNSCICPSIFAQHYGDSIWRRSAVLSIGLGIGPSATVCLDVEFLE